ncbi:MAG: DnaJ domain-containing protein [Hyphomicrobium sp.]
MMVHRFAIECDGVKQPWARIAEAGRVAGAKVPSNLPSGFAPVSSLAGRIVLPSLTKIDAAGVTRVAMQDLSPDSVMDRSDAPARRRDPAWTTTVRADAIPDFDSGAFRVAAWVLTLIVAMLGASLVAAGRWRMPAFEFGDAAGSFGYARNRAMCSVRNFCRAMDDRWRDASASWFANEDGPRTHALFNASLLIHTKLAEAELALVALPPGLLRIVLQAEIEKVRQRTADVDRRIRSRSQEKSAASFRALQRELDRITRIAQGAAAPQYRDDGDMYDAPQSQTDAYRILGLNSDAPQAAIKKLVEALRMTWHPDHARDEPDRQLREARMKQINAAWDLIRETRRAA